ncbi:hypothetical protein O9G_000970 [Rozella allomycis CSF55]|uniref:CUB domain-containing protein n=1 Tax=Rozella allomycis (strain CSF55) TaxID=988480 RepID=A0A075ANB5_ROZAC|nr:hypothetical protein O9G_000970 [Rozella allomycis CSF55]|eukprot:EPZ31325.1 hypothetical protein O9G_000970 [Rozella allomycis CSF55]
MLLFLQFLCFSIIKHQTAATNPNPQCKGIYNLTDSFGFISNSISTQSRGYIPNQNCLWFIQPSTSYSNITFEILDFEVDQLDSVDIYKGDTQILNHVLHVTRSVSYFVGNNTNEPWIISFIADGSYERDGFLILYYVDGIKPSNTCYLNCMNRGLGCVDNRCICQEGYEGAICLKDDKYYLNNIYDMCNGHSWIQNTQWKNNSLDPCLGMTVSLTNANWYGVECSTFRVTKLALAGNNLTCSSMPPLPRYIEYLDISFNKINNAMTDESVVGRYLSIYLAQNASLTGSIPSAFGRNTYLATINLSNNNLTGIIPDALNNLASLRMINLENNRLIGHIPNNFALLSDNKLFLQGNIFWCPRPNWKSVATFSCKEVNLYSITPNSGSQIGGYTVNITGNNFLSEIEIFVVFDDIKTNNILYMDNNLIQVVVPPHPSKTVAVKIASASNEFIGIDYATFTYLKECPQGTFREKEACALCPQGAFCKGGGEKPTPLFGYKESENVPLLFYQCFTKSDCLEDNTCSDGYKGSRCHACDTYTGFALIGKKCQKCFLPKVVEYLIALVAIILFVLYLNYSVESNKSN